MERPVTFRKDGRLVGILHEPEGQARGAGVVFIHGWSGYRAGPHRMFVEAARRLCAQGYHALRFDLRGRGDSEGQVAATDLDGMVDDARAARRFLLQETAVAATYWLGICSGGNVALGAASLEKDVDGLVLWSTPLFAPQKSRGQEAVRRGMFFVEYARKLFRRETWAKVLRGRVRLGIIARILFGRREPAEGQRDPKDSRRDVMADLRGYRGRALFVYGSKDDEAVGAPGYYRAFCRQEGIPARFHTVEGANHSYYSVAWTEEVLDRTLAWLAEASEGQAS
ncbi:MAG: alpha/beta fold hydrolase [Candidatus Brocadiia bacterium]